MLKFEYGVVEISVRSTYAKRYDARDIPIRMFALLILRQEP